MQYPSMKICFQTPTEDIFNAFEKKHETKLSIQYRRFMLNVGGGYPSADLVIDFEDNDAVVQVFFGMGIGGKDDIEMVIDRVSHWIDCDSMIPFASDAGGGKFCFSRDGNSDPSVYFIDGFDVIRISEDFDSFMSALVAYD